MFSSFQQMPPPTMATQSLAILGHGRGRGRGVLDWQTLQNMNCAPGPSRSDSEETMLADFLTSHASQDSPRPKGMQAKLEITRVTLEKTHLNNT